MISKVRRGRRRCITLHYIALHGIEMDLSQLGPTDNFYQVKLRNDFSLSYFFFVILIENNNFNVSKIKIYF